MVVSLTCLSSLECDFSLCSTFARSAGPPGDQNVHTYTSRMLRHCGERNPPIVPVNVTNTYWSPAVLYTELVAYCGRTSGMLSIVG